MKIIPRDQRISWEEASWISLVSILLVAFLFGLLSVVVNLFSLTFAGLFVTVALAGGVLSVVLAISFVMRLFVPQ